MEEVLGALSRPGHSLLGRTSKGETGGRTGEEDGGVIPGSLQTISLPLWGISSISNKSSEGRKGKMLRQNGNVDETLRVTPALALSHFCNSMRDDAKFKKKGALNL